MAWETVKRGTPNNSDVSVVTLRREGPAFSAFFIRAYNLEQMTHVTIHEDRENRRLGFLFHTNADDPDCLKLAPDGGGSNNGKAGRIVQARYLMGQPWLKSLMANRSERRFVPYKEQSIWAIDLGPAFEVEISITEANDALQIPAEVTGVYRYLDGDEITYIGRGRVRDRVQSQHREHWSFDRIQYSPLNDREQEHRWERILLDEYEMKHKKLPRENKVRGYLIQPEDE